MVAERRQAMVANCRWAVAQRDRFQYQQVRPIPVGATRDGDEPIVTD